MLANVAVWAAFFVIGYTILLVSRETIRGLTIRGELTIVALYSALMIGALLTFG